MKRERSTGACPARLPVFVAACLLAVLATPAAAQPRVGPDLAEVAGRDLIGTPAPALVVETIDGESIDLGALYGDKAVYLKFWATWCVPCLRQMPHFKNIDETKGPDLVVLGVNTGFNDSLPDVWAVIADVGLKMPTIIDDGRLAEAFNLRVTPQHVVIGRDGRIDHVGFFADDALDAALRAAQAPPDPRLDAPVVADVRAAGTEVEPPAAGDVLPDLTAVALDGRGFRTRDGEPRPTALVFVRRIEGFDPGLADAVEDVLER